MDARLTILMTADTVGGVWSYAMNLCAALAPHGVSVHLLTLGRKPDEQQWEQAKGLPNVTVHASDFKLEWMENPWKDVFLAREWIQSIYERVRPDLLHFNNFICPHPNWKCPVLTVFHSCVLSWWQSVKKENAPVSWDCYRDLVRSALEGSDTVVFPTHAILEKAKSIYSSIPNPAVIYNGASINLVNTAKHGFILSAGRLWDEAKNSRMLCDVADDLQWPVVLAGASNEPGISEPAHANVTLLGHLPANEIKSYMAQSSIFTMPAKYEPFGLAILEAAASGCALALGDIPTLRELWGDAAVYFDPFCDDDLRATLNYLTQDNALREEMAARATKRATRYTT